MLRLSSRRLFSFSLLRQAAPTSSSASGKTSEVPLSGDASDIPGFRESGQLASNYEIASGKERYEHLMKLHGQDAWKDAGPLVLKEKGTKENPVRVEGIDPVFYVGCSGFPAGSHELIFLTLRDKKTVDRCPHCGQAFKYTQHHLEGHH